MKKFAKVIHRSEAGFTLIELLVVVAILGVLAGVVVLNIAGFIGTGTCEAYCTEKHNIQTAVVAYMAENPTVTDPTYANAEIYLLTNPKYTWSGSISSGVVSDASDAPSGCDCLD